MRVFEPEGERSDDSDRRGRPSTDAAAEDDRACNCNDTVERSAARTQRSVKGVN